MDYRAAIVTGAGRGIGRQVAADLVAEGNRVLACARTVADLESLVEELGVDEVSPFVVDLADTDAADRIVAAALTRFGRLDIVVNNAGGPSAKRLDAMTNERWRAAFEVDFFGSLAMSMGSGSVGSLVWQGFGGG